ncbi:hypothetical protein VA7868_00418 [Vibrio aerogenes CECT 7868]|uniref:Uncharacterized protein n=1 Tax=Vibrio aerogenes CECT 7868 TaxID=1216006 RepID=A0A1M5VKH8_9VIBR|nr:chromosome partitioning protein ParA [Vibrio aerogenes]SHH75554.1 hypothetical protein VA7868_00418 [Vibrio aerogenes CECT 7868]
MMDINFSGLSTEFLLALAVDLGLFFFLLLFVILVFIIREFRRFSQTFHQENSRQEETVAMCRQSIERALNFVDQHGETLHELIQTQKVLEEQITALHGKNMTAAEQASVDDLNEQLSHSRELIGQLKNNLDRTVQGLRRAKDKLSKNKETMDSLRQEKEMLEQNFDQLEKEYVKLSSNTEKNTAGQFQREKETLLTHLEKLKERVTELEQQGEDQSSLLEQTKQQLHHTQKEKDFIEKKYLELVSEKNQSE